MTKVVTTQMGENITHRILFSAAKWHLAQSKNEERGSFYADLAAMTFAFHALEAYLNFLLERIAPTIFADERNYFRKEPYRGFEGKLRKVVELCGLPVPAPGVEPYGTVFQLKGLRDAIAHGRVEKTSTTVVHTTEEEPPWLAAPFDGLVSPQKAISAVNSVHSFCIPLHQAAMSLTNYNWFGDDPFIGIQAYSSSDSKFYS